MKVHKLLLPCLLILAGASPLMATLTVSLTPNPAGPASGWNYDHVDR